MLVAPGKKTQRASSVPSGNGRPPSALANAVACEIGTSWQQRLPEHLAAALKKRWKCYRKELKRCQKKFSEKAVHQFRVESRRLLSLIELSAAFLPAGRVEKIRRCLKRHLDTFDDLRDIHVQLQLIKKLTKEFPEAAVFESYLRKREKRVDRRTQKDVRGVKTKPLAKLISVCREDLERCLPAMLRAGFPGSGFARLSSRAAEPAALLVQSVDLAFQRTLKLKDRIDPERPKTIHCTRIAFKKFRYMVEMLCGFLPVFRPGQMAAMHRYQTLMGDVQDRVVLIGAFDKFRAKKELKTDHAAALSPKNFRDALIQSRDRLITRYLDRANQLCSFWPAKSPLRKL